MNTTEARRLATVKEACQYGKFSKTKAYALINDAKIRAYKLEGRTLIDLASVDAYHEATLVPIMPHPKKRK